MIETQCPGAPPNLYTAIEKAALELTGKFAHREAVMQEARFAIEEIAPKKNYDHRLMGYNNDPTSTFADIKHVLALTEARIVKRLESEKQEAEQGILPTPSSVTRRADARNVPARHRPSLVRSGKSSQRM